MPKAQLPITGPAWNNSDDQIGKFSRFSPELVNGFVDDLGLTHIFPGLEEWTNIDNGRPLTGLYWWNSRKFVIAVDNGGNVFKVSKTGTVTDLTGDALTGLNRPTFADDGTNLIIADGGQMVWTDGTTSTAFIADTDAPTTVTHVAFIDQYILANDVSTSGVFYWSDVGDYSSWTATSFATAEAKPDDLLALIVSWREVTLLGKFSIEIWLNEGSDPPFIRNNPAYIDRGISAPYSVVELNNTLYYLDTEGKLNLIRSRSPQSPSKAVEKIISGFDKFDDCLADVIEIEGRNFLFLTFPDANKTLVHDYITGSWYQRSYWNDQNYSEDRWLGSCHVYCPDWNMHLVGDRRGTGKIFKMASDIYDDDGQQIRFRRLTQDFDYGSKNNKRSSWTQLRLKRGEGGATGTEPVLMVRVKDDNKAWGSERRIGLGLVGDDDITIKEYFPGIFKTRQYEFTYTAAKEFAMADGEEEVTLLTR
jgi:hypothetical protein